MIRNTRAVAHDNNFNLLRLLAACQVVASHAGSWLDLQGRPSIMWMFPGVPVFFVISGYLISGSLLKDPSLPRYAKNRALRIYPGMIANLFIISVMMIATGVITLRGLVDINLHIYFGVIAATGWTMFAGFISTPPFSYGPNTLPFFPGGALWTIGVELGFYLVAPILIVSRWRAVLIPLAFTASLALAIAQMSVKSPWIDTTIPAYLWIFLLGVGARLAWPFIGWMFKGTFPIWLAIHLAFWVGPTYKNPHPAVILSVITLAGCVISFAHTLPSLAKILGGVDLSYGVYLYHMPVIMMFMWLGMRGDIWLWPAVYALTCALAAASWFFVENPALTLKNYRNARSMSVIPTAGPSTSKG